MGDMKSDSRFAHSSRLLVGTFQSSRHTRSYKGTGDDDNPKQCLDFFLRRKWTPSPQRMGVMERNKLAVAGKAEAAEWHRAGASPSLMISSSFAMQLSFLVNRGLSLLSCAAHPLCFTQIENVLFMHRHRK